MKRLGELIGTGLRFFPIQLLFLHIKKSHLLLVLWLLLFGFVTQTLASKFGFPYLFLSPEYLGEVGSLSFFILGFSIGGFFMAYHLYSYVIMGPSFPFLATLSRPFYKFCINNSVIPVLFYGILLYNIIDVQSEEELRSAGEIAIQILSLTGGIILFIILSVFYFFKTNFDILNFQTRSKRRGWYALVGTLFSKKNYWFESPLTKIYQPSYYFSSLRGVKLAREARHYDRKLTKEIFQQNHLNASIFEIAMLGSFLMLGIFQNYPVFQIPSGACYILLSTVALMLITILTSWFKGWAVTVLIGMFLGVNFLSTQFESIQPENKMYGLDYENKVEYNLANLQSIQYAENDLLADLQHQQLMLENWHKKASLIQGTNKPRLLIVNCSGGGLRSAMWTFHVFEELDQRLKGQFFPNVQMITGASGGMIGASYYRDLYRTNPQFSQENDDKYLNNISKDLLNSVCFNLACHDMFFRYKRVTIDGETYVRDRGFAFEQQLNKNTDQIMSDKLGDYADEEFSAKIPLMIFSPTIINDGRRMIIATQPMSYLNGTQYTGKDVGPENVEFIRLFENNNPLNTQYSSVLRANSTFPYVLPMVSMPTSPKIQLMDAGIRDNYGTKTTLRYIAAAESWLEEKTSGIIILQIRDISKDYDITDHHDPTLMDHIFEPVMNFYGNYHHAQEFDAQELIENGACENVPIDVVSFVLREDPNEKISLSWHLTQREKNDIKKTFHSKKNQKEVQKLIDLLQ